MSTAIMPTADTMHRGAKLFMDRGEASDYAGARAILEGFRINVVVGADVAESEAAQVALLTLVNAARRTFLGGVHVVDCPGSPPLTPLAGAASLRKAVERLGGTLAATATPDVPAFAIGNADPVGGGQPTWRVTWEGWTAGVVPLPSKVRLAETGNNMLAPVLAGALAAGEAFQFLSGDCVYSGKRTMGLSLWAPSHYWLDASAVGPKLSWLPSHLWLIGLGNLGQAYLWCLGALPYVEPGEVRLVLQDDDEVQASNDSTSVLINLAMVGLRKARAMAMWAERRGFQACINERRFGFWTQRADEAGDPAVALCGVDNALARMALEEAGYPLVIEAGLGAGPQGYRTFSTHSFPARRRAAEIWRRVLDQPAATDPSDQPAYNAARRAGMDECGLLQLASHTVGVPFVGLTAATLVIAELLRRIHGGVPIEVLAGNLGALEDLECVTGADAPYAFGLTASS